MAVHKLNDIWEIIKMNNFENTNEISNELLCLFCKKILINAYSGPCGCRYCFECITNFLNGNEAFCPGFTDECKEELLSINANVHVENSINRQISRLTVKCPEKDCQFKMELREIENHKRVCNFRSENCPYFNIGCKQSNVCLENIKNHLLDEIVSHSKLLLDFVNNLENEKEMFRNEIDWLKNRIDQLENYNNSLRTEIDTMRSDRNNSEMKMTDLERKESTNHNEILELNEEMAYLKNENRAMKRSFENLQKKIANREIPKEFEVKRNPELTFSKQKEMEELINEMYFNHGDLKKKSDNQDNLIKDIIDRKLNYLQQKIFDLEEKVGKKEIPCEFEWIIDNFHQKWYTTEPNIKIFSRPFYSHKNGYKMCLCLFPTGHFTSKRKSLAIDFHIMKGQHDDILQWPFKHGVEISLIDQSSGVPHVSVPLEFEDCPTNEGWQKPINERNKPITFIKLIDIVHLLKDRNLYTNDQIILKCQVNVMI